MSTALPLSRSRTCSIPFFDQWPSLSLILCINTLVHVLCCSLQLKSSAFQKSESIFRQAVDVDALASENSAYSKAFSPPTLFAEDIG